MPLDPLRISVVAKVCIFVSALLVPSVAMAQADFPSGSAFRAGVGTYGTFDANAQESHSIANLQEGDVYRVCLVGGSGKLIVDGSEVAMDRGDCHDAFGTKFDFQADTESNGFYTHPIRGR